MTSNIMSILLCSFHRDTHEFTAYHNLSSMPQARCSKCDSQLIKEFTSHMNQTSKQMDFAMLCSFLVLYKRSGLI